MGRDDDAKDDAEQNGGRDRDNRHASVDRDLHSGRQCVGERFRERGQRPIGDGDPAKSANDREQHRFGDRNRSDPAPPRAQRGENRELLPPTGRSRKKKRDHVGARNREKQRNASGQDQECGPNRTDRLLGHGHEPDADASVCIGVRRRARSRDSDHLGARLIERHALHQTTYHWVVMTDLIALLRGRHPHREPQLVVAGERSREERFWRHHPDDRRGNAVQLDGATHHGGIGRKAPPPDPVAEKDDRRRR